MTKLYAFLWHVNHDDMVTSEGAGGSYCESAETEKSTGNETKSVLEAWLAERQESCDDSGCEHTPIITNELRLKMIMTGMASNMVKVS